MSERSPSLRETADLVVATAMTLAVGAMILNQVIGRPATSPSEAEFRQQALAAAASALEGTQSMEHRFSNQYIGGQYLELPWRTGGRGLLGYASREDRTVSVGQICLQGHNPLPGYITTYQPGRVVWGGPKMPIVGIPGSSKTTEIPPEAQLDQTGPNSFAIIRDDEQRTALRFAIDAKGIVTPETQTAGVIAREPHDCDVTGVPVQIVDVSATGDVHLTALGHVGDK